MRSFCLFIAVLLLVAAPSRGVAQMPSLVFYAETVALEPGGGATVTVHLTASGITAGQEFPVPYAHATGPDSLAWNSPLAMAAVRKIAGQYQLFLTSAKDATPGDTLTVQFHLRKASVLGGETTEEFGNTTITYKMVQSLPGCIPLMTARVVLPEGIVVNKVLSTTPAGKANASSSPYAIGMVNGRHCVTLSDSTVHQGDQLAMQFQAKSGKKSPLILAGLFVAAVGYLIAFRELLKAKV
jgi:hypothetical protein